LGERTHPETLKPSDFNTNAGALAIIPKPKKPMRLCSGLMIGALRHSIGLSRMISRHVAMETENVHDDYSVIIGSPLGGSTLPSGTFGSFGCLIKDSTPAARLNIAFKFGKTGSRSKSGCMNARYSMSLNSPASGQMRIAKSGSCSLNVSRHAFALPICLSSSIMSSAIRPPKRLVLDYFRSPPALGEAVSVGDCSAKNAWPPQPKTLPEMGTKLIFVCQEPKQTRLGLSLLRCTSPVLALRDGSL